MTSHENTMNKYHVYPRSLQKVDLIFFVITQLYTVTKHRSCLSKPCSIFIATFPFVID